MRWVECDFVWAFLYCFAQRTPAHIVQHLCSNTHVQIASLRQMLTQYQEKLHALEMSNYSLALHLKRATDESNAGMHAHRHPDVC